MLNNLTVLDQDINGGHNAETFSAPPAPPTQLNKPTQLTPTPMTTLTNVQTAPIAQTATVLPPTALQIAAIHQPPDFLSPMMENAQEVAAHLDSNRLDELQNVLAFLNTTACVELMKFCTLQSTPDNVATHGRLTFNIPSSEFHGILAGHFQLKVLWPVITDGKLTVRLSIGYKVEPNGHATLLTTGGGRGGDNKGFRSISTANVDLADLLNSGYIAEEHHERLIRLCVNGVGSDKALFMLVPAENTMVTFSVRNLIRPADNGKRTDLPPSTKEVGAQCGWGISSIAFSKAVLLPGLNALENAAVTTAYSGKSFADFQREVRGESFISANAVVGLTSTAPTNGSGM